MGADIVFENLGISIQTLDPVAFSIFGLEIYWYGIIISTAILAGLLTATSIAKKTGQNPETYTELLIYGLVGSIVGARLYYVAFSWEYYKNDIIKIFALREGGIAILGGVIGGAIVCILFAKWKKINPLLIMDTCAAGMILGQAIGRWGNFFNMEAFGGYTESLFAMAINVEKAKYLPQELMDKLLVIDQTQYIQVHPTFFYEFAWNLAVFIIIMMFIYKKKFDGEVVCMYFVGYGLGRVWIEGLRTDQLLIGNTNIPVSQLLAGILVIVFSFIWIRMRRNLKPNEN